ncbi:MAG: hypothetical protein Kow0077_10760 [Anaerolineae bacterium]
MKRSSNTIAAVIGLVMVLAVIISMLLTTFLPTGAPQPRATPIQQVLEDPTLAPIIFPTPDPDGPGLVRTGLAVHPSGTFTIARIAGFEPSTTTSETIHSLSLVDSTRYAVVHAYLQQHAGPQDVNTLDIYYSPATLAATWSEYDNWEETGREHVDNQLVIDFSLTLGQNTYLARQRTWPVPEDPSIVYVLRLVVPDNNLALLGELEFMIIPSYQVLPDSLGAPFNWPGIVSTAAGYVLRYPPTWTPVNEDASLIASLTLPDNQGTLTLRSEDSAVASLDEAQALVETSRENVTILSTAPISRAQGDGYAVAYTFATADGEAQSGLSLLINGPDGRAKHALVRLAEPETDLLDADTQARYADLWTALATFAPLPADAILPVTAAN